MQENYKILVVDDDMRLRALLERYLTEQGFQVRSVANAERYLHVAALLQSAPAPRVVVVSAMQGVTDALTALAAAPANGEDWQQAWSQLRDRHFAEAQRLDPEDAHALHAWLDAEFAAPLAAVRKVVMARSGSGSQNIRIHRASASASRMQAASCSSP